MRSLRTAVLRIRTLAYLAAGTTLLSADMCNGSDAIETVTSQAGDVVVRITNDDRALIGWSGFSRSTKMWLFKTKPGQTYTPDLSSVDLLALDSLKISWQSSNNNVAIVANDARGTSSNPQINFVGPGTAKITGTLNDPRVTLASGVSGSVSIDITVSDPPTKLQLTPHGGTVTVGQTLSFKLTATSASGAAVISTGRENVQFTCVSVDKCVVNEADTIGASYSVNSGTPSPIDGSMNIRGLRPGTGKIMGFIVAQKGADVITLASDTITVTVVAAVVPARVTIDPASASVFVGGTKQLSASVFDASNKLISTSVTWQTKDPNLAAVNFTGLVSGLSTGTGSPVSNTVQIVAKAADGVEATATVTIYKPVSNVLVEPRPFTMDVGLTHQFTATLRDNNNATIPSSATKITWSTGSNSIATVDANGLVTSKAAGQTTVVATTAEGIIGSSDLTVNAAPATGPITRVVVSPDSVDVPFAARSFQFTAKAFDANNNEVPVPGGFRWLVDDSTVGSVDSNGLVSFRGPGKSRIRAFFGNDANAPGGSGVLKITP